MDRAWRERHPDYDRARRWQPKLRRAAEGLGVVAGPSRGALAGVPWDLVEGVLGPGGAVIVLELSRLCLEAAQEEIRGYILDFEGETRRLGQVGAQEEIEPYSLDFEGETHRLRQVGAQDEIAGAEPP